MMSPRWIAPDAPGWLAAESAGVTGRVFEASGQSCAIAEGWHRGPTGTPVEDINDVDKLFRGLLAQARPNADMQGRDKADW